VQRSDVAAEAIGGGGRGAEENDVFAEEGFAGVLHAAEGEAGDENDVVLGEGEGLLEVVGEPGHAAGGDFLELRNFGFGARELRFADVDAGLARRGMHADPRAGGEGEEIGGDGLGFGEFV